MNTSATFSLSQRDKELVESILKKIEKEKDKKGFRIVTFDNLFNLLNTDEVSYIRLVRE